MTMPAYVIRGGPQGRERLRLLASVMWPTTRELFARIGISTNARCLDLGCGGGDVSVELARLAPDGQVLGIDLDEAKIELARAEAAAAGIGNVRYRIADVMDPLPDSVSYDLAYLRFVLTHLTDPATALTNVVRQLAPGGVVVVEDIDFRGHFCHPASAAFDNFVAWYTAAVQGRGADPNIGPRLPGLLAGAGLAEVRMNIVQPAGTTGDIKVIAPITLEAIADAVLTAGIASTDEFNTAVDELYAFARTDGTVVSGPRIVQCWGQRSR
jgi:ubiquinone/menaquinone biosynthesis C-methylase UbiE